MAGNKLTVGRCSERGGEGRNFMHKEKSMLAARSLCDARFSLLGRRGPWIWHPPRLSTDGESLA